jgi:hypothetical protein
MPAKCEQEASTHYRRVRDQIGVFVQRLPELIGGPKS